MSSSNLKITTTGKMAQHAIFFPRLQINSKIFYYRPFVTCRPLPRFTHSLNYSERSLVLKSVTERNSMSCGYWKHFHCL